MHSYSNSEGRNMLHDVKGIKITWTQLYFPSQYTFYIFMWASQNYIINFSSIHINFKI